MAPNAGIYSLPPDDDRAARCEIRGCDAIFHNYCADASICSSELNAFDVLHKVFPSLPDLGSNSLALVPVRSRVAA